MLQKNQEAQARKERRMKAGTFIGCRPHCDKLKTKYDRKAAKRETHREAQNAAKL